MNKNNDSWMFGNLSDEYVFDDYIDMYLEIKALFLCLENGMDRYKNDLHYYQHCYSCLVKSFGFDLNDVIKNLSSDNQLMIDFYINKAFEISTPTSGWQMYSVFYSQHGEKLREISFRTSKILFLYRKIIEEIIQHENNILKMRVSKEEILAFGYNKELIPKIEELKNLMIYGNVFCEIINP